MFVRSLAIPLALALSIHDAQAFSILAGDATARISVDLSVDVDDAALPSDLPYLATDRTLELDTNWVYIASFYTQRLGYGADGYDGTAATDRLALGTWDAFYDVNAFKRYPSDTTRFAETYRWELDLRSAVAASWYDLDAATADGDTTYPPPADYTVPVGVVVDGTATLSFDRNFSVDGPATLTLVAAGDTEVAYTLVRWESGVSTPTTGTVAATGTTTVDLSLANWYVLTVEAALSTGAIEASDGVIDDQWGTASEVTWSIEAAPADTDGDGLDDEDDLCPAEDATGWDLDLDGCIDDSDTDGFPDDVDTCPDGDDLDDGDGDGVAEACDICPGDALNDQDGDGLCTVDVDGEPVDVCPHDPVGSDDLDGDTVCNSDDVCPDGDDLLDTDDDQIADDCDLCPLDAANDADGDLVCGDVDVCVGDDGVDSDGDGVPDDCDALCPFDPTNDADFDGVCGEDDACPLDYLDDSDGDGACDSDDVCPGADDFDDGDVDGVVDCQDTCPLDVENDGDGDGLCASDDNCAGAANPDQADADADGVGDACEPDSDGDGVIDDEDNCPTLANVTQADDDGDGQGDACDADDDSDGVIDGRDRCADTPAATPVVSNGCSAAQTCPTTTTWKSHGAYVSCVADVAERLYAQGQVTKTEATGLITAAAASNVGKHRRDREREHGGHGHDGGGYCRD